MTTGMWHSGSAAALHAASPGFDPPLLQASNFQLVTCSTHVGCFPMHS